MTKGRKTTLSERIEIAQVCIEHGKDYNMTATVYKVSYHQVYQWVKKYEEQGENALIDRRGKGKPEFNENDNTLIQMKLKRLEMENERLTLENDFLKKLHELEGREV